MSGGYAGPKALEGTVSVILQAINATNVPTAADSLPTYRVYDGTTLITSGTSVAFDSGNITGAYRISFAATSALGFARNKTYAIYGKSTVTSTIKVTWWYFTIT